MGILALEHCPPKPRVLVGMNPCSTVGLASCPWGGLTTRMYIMYYASQRVGLFIVSQVYFETMYRGCVSYCFLLSLLIIWKRLNIITISRCASEHERVALLLRFRIIQCLNKVFIPLDLFHILFCYSLNSIWIKLFISHPSTNNAP